MARAGIFIGVDQTGGLQHLNDAASGAARMRDWAIGQDMIKDSEAILITDTNNRVVRPDEVYNAIDTLLKGPGVDQLIVYFAGHGVNINRGEQWLLTEAPRNSSAAVNLKGSVELAQYSGIKHVVFISDACRVAPEGIQAQNIRGIEIFPNDSTTDTSNPVDQFFACGLGRTAAETRDPKDAADNYAALYTDALLSALKGEAPAALKPEPPEDPQFRFVAPGRLRDFLAEELPRRILKRGLAAQVNQSPDAIVIESPNWISRIARGSIVEVRRTLLPVPPSIATVAHAHLNQVISGFSATGVDPALARALDSAAAAIEPTFGPDHFETECGFKVRGAQVIEVFSANASGQLLSDSLVRVQTHAPCVSILLCFDNQTCAQLPAIHGYIAALTVEDGELADIAYEPATTNYRWGMFRNRLGELRRLRGIIARAAQNGYFKLEAENALKLANSMRFEKSIDPALAVYAAYAFHDLQRRDLICDMTAYLKDDIQTRLFDLELLGRRFLKKSWREIGLVAPYFPMLSQGWDLLKANRFAPHPSLDFLQDHLKNSLWTLFDAGAFDQLRENLHSPEII